MNNKKSLNERIQIIKTLTQSQKHLPTCLSKREIAKAAKVGTNVFRIMENNGLIEKINNYYHWVEMERQKENLIIVNVTSEYNKYNKTLNEVYKKKPTQKEENIDVDSNAESQNNLNSEEFLLKMINNETKMANLILDITRAFKKYLDN
jgi:hypothetical protein